MNDDDNNDHNNDDDGKFITRQELADKLGMAPRTLRRRLKEAGITIKGIYISPQSVKEIIEAICAIKK